MSFEADIKDCTDCPSYLSPAEARTFFDDSGIFTPMCARLGKLLAAPVKGETNVPANVEVVQKTAASCKWYGFDKPSSPLQFTPTLFMPDTKALEAVGSATSKAGSCLECKNAFVSDKHDVYGCKARGVVLFSSRLRKEAEGCDWNTANSGPLEHMSAPKLLPQFTVTKVAAPKAKALFSTIDPTSSESDGPVAEKDKHMIQAWRKLDMPASKREHFFPIFRTDFFSDEEQEMIPKAGDPNADPSLYVDHTGLLAKFVTVSYARDMQLCYVGEPGSGKTNGVRWLAWQMNMPFHRIQYNEYTEPEQALGLQQVRGGETIFEPGFLPRNLQKPCHVLSDEYNLPQEGIQQFYRELLDDSRELTIYGHRFRRHDYCFHHMAINPSWDYRNIGAKEMASADVRRLTFHWMNMPDRATCAGIIGKALDKMDGEKLTSVQLKALLDVSEDLREMVKQGKLPHHWTLSQDIKVARLAIDWPLIDAYKIAYLDYLDPQTASVAESTIKSRLPFGV